MLSLSLSSLFFLLSFFFSFAKRGGNAVGETRALLVAPEWEGCGSGMGNDGSVYICQAMKVWRANGEHRDREWQKWPITIVTGAYLGWGIGSFAGGYLFRGKRIKFD